MQEQYRKGLTKDSLKALRLRVEAIQDDAAITLHDGSKVTQKELLSDLIDNQLLLISGKPPYCVLCGRKKLAKFSHPCVHCGCTSTASVKCCSNCKQLKEYVTSSCLNCGCRSTESFQCCTNCKRTKVTTIRSHAIPKCTLEGLEEESGGPVIYSYKHGTIKPARDVTWHILCSHCERANKLNVAESTMESIRCWLNCDETDDCDAKIGVHYVNLMLFAAAFNIYRGFMVTVDLLSKLSSPSLARPLLQTFYSLKRYCKNPIGHPPPDIYFFLLPSFNILFNDISRDVKKAILHDPYMRMIKFTHVATAVPDSPEHSFLYTSFDRFHFVLPLPRCKEDLIPAMLSRYPQSDLSESEEFCPNLSQHQSKYLVLRNGPVKLCKGQTGETFFPQLLYRIGYAGAKKLKKMCLSDIEIHEYLKIEVRSVRGFINVCDEGSRIPAPPQGRSKQRKPVKVVEFVRHPVQSNPVQEVGDPVQSNPVQEVGDPVQSESV